MLLGPGYVTGWFLEQRSFSSQLCRACKIKLDVRCTSLSFSPSSACSESARSLESPSKLCSYQTCRIVSPLKSEYILSCSGFQTWKMASERYSFSLTTFSPRYFEMSNTFLWKGGIYLWKCHQNYTSIKNPIPSTLKIVRHIYPTVGSWSRLNVLLKTWSLCVMIMLVFWLLVPLDTKLCVLS